MVTKLTAIFTKLWRKNCHTLAEVEILAEIRRLYGGDLQEEERNIIVHYTDALCSRKEEYKWFTN